MFRKIFRIFRKDVKIATRDTLLIYIMVIPIILAVGILFFAPGITDSASTFAMLDDESEALIDYMKTYVKVETFPSIKELERRVLKRDDAVGIVFDDGDYEIILEGNESRDVARMPEMMMAFYQLGATRENTTAEIISFGKKVPSLKTNLVNMLILMIIMLSGMIIALGIVEEKSDNTISAMNVSPVSQNGFILGKSLLGGSVALLSIIISLLILGYYDINWFMIILVGVTTMILSIIVGFLQGIHSSDVIEAAGGVKIMMLPIAGSIAGYELLSDKWQWTMYWSPFYWSYKANDMILSKTAVWTEVGLCALIVLVISISIYLIAMPRIRKGLSRS